jgi:hypothetical protein
MTLTDMEKMHALREAEGWVRAFKAYAEVGEYDSKGDELENDQQLGLAGCVVDMIKKNLAGKEDILQSLYEEWLKGFTYEQRKVLDRRLSYYNIYDEWME